MYVNVSAIRMWMFETFCLGPGRYSVYFGGVPVEFLALNVWNLWVIILL